MGSSKVLAVLLTKFAQIIVLFLKNEVSSITSSLVLEILKALVTTCIENRWGSSCPKVLVALLLWKDIVLILDNEIYVRCKILVKAMELRRKLITDFELLLQEPLDVCIGVIYCRGVFLVEELPFTFDVFVLGGVVLLYFLLLLCLVIFFEVLYVSIWLHLFLVGQIILALKVFSTLQLLILWRVIRINILSFTIIWEGFGLELLWLVAVQLLMVLEVSFLSFLHLFPLLDLVTYLLPLSHCRGLLLSFLFFVRLK